MKCKKYIDQIHFYIDNNIDPMEDMELSKHLDNCSRCREEYVFYKSFKSEIQDLFEPVNLPESFYFSVNKKLDRIQSENQLFLKLSDIASIIMRFIKTKVPYEAAGVLVTVIAMVIFFKPFDKKQMSIVDEKAALPVIEEKVEEKEKEVEGLEDNIVVKKEKRTKEQEDTVVKNSNIKVEFNTERLNSNMGSGVVQDKSKDVQLKEYTEGEQADPNIILNLSRPDAAKTDTRNVSKKLEKDELPVQKKSILNFSKNKSQSYEQKQLEEVGEMKVMEDADKEVVKDIDVKDQDYENIKAAVTQNGGKIVSENKESGKITVEIPKENYDNFMQLLNKKNYLKTVPANQIPEKSKSVKMDLFLEKEVKK